MININGTLCPVLIPNTDSYQSLQQPNNTWNVWQKPSSSNMPSPFQVFDPNANFSSSLMRSPHQNEAHTIQQAMRIKRLKTPTIQSNIPVNKTMKKLKTPVTKKPPHKTMNPETKLKNKTSFDSVSFIIMYLN